MSVDEVLILSTKDFNKRQGESQQEIAEEKVKEGDVAAVKRAEPDRTENFLNYFLNRNGLFGFIFYNVTGELAEGGGEA